jgi:hypothetical protein
MSSVYKKNKYAKIDNNSITNSQKLTQIRGNQGKWYSTYTTVTKNYRTIILSITTSEHYI